MIISRIVVAYCALLLIACTTNNEEDTTKTYEQNASEVCKYCKTSSWVTKLTRTHIVGTLEQFKITADELSKRQRKGRIIEFVNYDELYFKRLTIDQPLKSKIVKFDRDEIALLMSFDGNRLVEQTDQKVLGSELNRVLVDEIRINFKPSNPKNKPIALTANYAKILTDTMTMRFEGKVTLKAAQCKLSSEVAVWSSIYNGIFLSESFQFNNRTYEPPAFFQINDAGKCQKVRSIVDIEYVDKLDAIEEKILESMPMSARFIFGLMGSSNNLNGIVD